MTPFLRKIVFFSSGGSFLDGYVLALIGVALTQITPLFDLTETWSALIGASVFLGILIGTVVGGYLTDLIGRPRYVHHRLDSYCGVLDFLGFCC